MKQTNKNKALKSGTLDHFLWQTFFPQLQSTGSSQLDKNTTPQKAISQGAASASAVEPPASQLRPSSAAASATAGGAPAGAAGTDSSSSEGEDAGVRNIAPSRVEQRAAADDAPPLSVLAAVNGAGIDDADGLLVANSADDNEEANVEAARQAALREQKRVLSSKKTPPSSKQMRRSSDVGDDDNVPIFKKNAAEICPKRGSQRSGSAKTATVAAPGKSWIAMMMTEKGRIDTNCAMPLPSLLSGISLLFDLKYNTLF